MRIKFSIIFVGLGIIIGFLPKPARQWGEVRPAELFQLAILNTDNSISPDLLARMIVNEDSSLSLIDLRDSAEFQKCNLPSSLNIPFTKFLDEENLDYLSDPKRKIVLYSNDDFISNEAYVLGRRKGFMNIQVLQGGLNNWFQKVMLSEYSGDKITPEENEIFEIRYKARHLFSRLNSLPDSLKMAYVLSKKAEEKKLVGGCE